MIDSFSFDDYKRTISSRTNFHRAFHYPERSQRQSGSHSSVMQFSTYYNNYAKHKTIRPRQRQKRILHFQGIIIFSASWF